MQVTWLIITLLGVLLVVGVSAVPLVFEADVGEQIDEGEVVEGTIELPFFAPVDPGTIVQLKLGTSQAQRLLTEIFDDDGVTYFIDGGSLTLGDPADSKNFVFADGGVQTTYFKLPGNSVVQDVSMKIHGFKINNSYPSFPSLDIGKDGDVEWMYIAGLEEYGEEILPGGLEKSQQGGSASLTDSETYYCEVIDLPSARDFEVSVKHQQLVEGANTSAVLFSLVQGPSGVKGQGGADSCDLPEGGSTYQTTSCEIHLPYFVEGKKLVCVYNSYADVGGSSSTKYENIQMDNEDAGNAYVCGALSSAGVTSCTANDKDFVISVKPGQYDGKLMEQADFANGLTEFDLVDALNNALDDCDDDTCSIPVGFSSDTSGLLYVSGLEVEYSKGISGGSFMYSKFYDGKSSGGSISKIKNVDLTKGNTSVVVDVGTFALLAPVVNATSNMTLTVTLIPGSSWKVNMTVVNVVQSVSSDVGASIKAYKDVLTSVQQAHPALLQLLGYQDDVQGGISKLNSYLTQYQALNGSSKSPAEKAAILANLTTQTQQAVKNMPESFVITKKITDVVVPGITDMYDAVLLQHPKTQDIKDKFYAYQGQVTVEGTAEYYTLEFFDGKEERGTLITKKIMGGSGSIVEVIPGVDVSSVKFDDDPDVLQNSGPGIVAWKTASQVQYVLVGDKTDQLQNLKTFVIPPTIPQFSAPPSLVSYRCGDGVCSSLETSDGLIALEDSVTCPQDCSTPKPYSTWLVGLLIIVAIVWYLNFYHGSLSLDRLFKKKPSVQKSSSSKPFFSFGGVMKKPSGKLFSTPGDERNLTSYVEDALKKGFSKSKISGALLAKGWTRDQVESAFSKARK